MRRRDALRAGGALIGTGLFGASGGTRTVSATAAGRESDYGPLGHLELAGTKEAVVGPDGETVYLALTDGYGIVDVSDPADPTVLAERRTLQSDTEAGAMAQIYDVTLSGDTLAVVGPANPVGEGWSGAVIVDVSNPAAPTRRAVFPTEYPIHNCFLDGSELYLTANGPSGNPLVVVDVSGDEPAELARWSLTDHEAAWRDVPGGLRPLHDVWVRDGLAALAYWDAGTYLLDVSDPADPIHVGTIPAGDPAELSDPPLRASLLPPGNHHYVATDPTKDLLAVGKESWGARVEGEYVGGPSGVDLYDVSDPSAPTRLAGISPPSAADPTYGGVWTTAHNLELRDGTLYTSWYRGGVKRHDVSDPATPVEETWWVRPGETRFWTARVAAGDSFVASSMGTGEASAGLWTFPDEAGTGGDPEALRERPETDPADAYSPTPSATATPASATSVREGTATGTGGSSAAAPGFGVLAGLGGLGLAAWRLLGRR
ncbi:LVIVD repeat-containing protein [Halorarum halobium]|uniref:LVIVD repeat-containing protein n=1 Tax=Halorarum halobium TaxID=3075121 RepID=UPI0028AB3170|nr:hypothetical protein [Halobaculum sp. XH14]